MRWLIVSMAAAILVLGWLCHAEHEKACEWEAKCESAVQSLEKMQASLDASRNATEKPSLTGALKENAEKVKAQPAKSAGKNEQSL